MAGMERAEPPGSTALLGVNFDNGFGKKTPPSSLIDCKLFVPAASFRGFGRLAMAATEAPGAALSNHLLFFKI